MKHSMRGNGVAACGVAALATLAASGTASAGLINLSDPLNVLDGQTVTVSSTHVLTGTFGLASKVVDDLAPDQNEDAGFLFGDSDGNQRLSISGFNSGFQKVRLYSVPTDSNRSPATLVLRSSTSLTTSLTATDYETSLGTFPLTSGDYQPYVTGVLAVIRGYVEVSVSAPAGTRSLYVGFPGPSGQGDRVYEVQALIPEPSTAAILTLLAPATLMKRRRR